MLELKSFKKSRISKILIYLISLKIVLASFMDAGSSSHFDGGGLS